MPATASWSVQGGIIQGSATGNSLTVKWGNYGNGQLQLHVVFQDGFIYDKNVCIEKIRKPQAAYYVAPTNTFDPPMESLPGHQNSYMNYYACTNQSLSMVNISYPNTGLTYEWLIQKAGANGDFTTYDGISYPSHTAAPEITFVEEGIYQITLTVTNECGCSHSFTRNFIINDAQPVVIDCPGFACWGYQAEYTVSDQVAMGCDAQATPWSVQGGTIISQTPKRLVVFWDDTNGSGYGLVTYDPTGCGTTCLSLSTVRIPVIEPQNPITGPTQLCANSINGGTYTLPQWPSTTYTWSINTTGAESPSQVAAQLHQIPNQPNQVRIFPNPNLNQSTIKLDVEYFNSILRCGGRSEITITLNSNPIIGPTKVCAPQTVSYSTTSSNVKWELKFNGTLVYSAQNTATINYAFASSDTDKTYVLKLTPLGSSQVACGISQINILVGHTPQPIQVLGPSKVCLNNHYEYQLNPDNYYRYEWEFDNGYFPNYQTTAVGAGPLTTYIGGVPAHISVNAIPLNADNVCATPQYTLFTIEGDYPNGSIQPFNSTGPISLTTVCPDSTSKFRLIDALTGQAMTNYSQVSWRVEPSNIGSITSGNGTNEIEVTWYNTPNDVMAHITADVRRCNSMTSSIRYDVTVTKSLQLALTSNPSETVCSGRDVTFQLSNNQNANIAASNLAWTANGVPINAISLGNNNYKIQLRNASTTANSSVTIRVQLVNSALSCGNNNISASLNFTVLPATPVALSVTGGLIFCSKNDIQTNFTVAVGINPGSTLHWYLNGALIAAWDNDIAIDPNQIKALDQPFGSYHFEIVDANGCLSISNSFSIGMIGCTDLTCPGVTCNFDVTAFRDDATCSTIKVNGGITGTSPNSYGFSIFGPGISQEVSNVNNTSWNVNQVGLYNVYMWAKYNCEVDGQGITEKRMSPIHQVIIPYLSSFQYSVTRCTNNNLFNIALTNNSTYYTGISGPITQFYTLTTPSGNTEEFIADAYIIRNGLPAGTYTLTLTISAPGYAPCSVSQTLTLQGVPGFTISYTPNPILCYGKTITFNPTIPQGSYTYNWKLNPSNNTISGVKNPQIVYLVGTEKLVQLTVTNELGCSRTQSTLVAPLPQPVFKGHLSGSAEPVCSDHLAPLQYMGPTDLETPPAAFQWRVGNDVISSATSYQSITPTQSGNYTLTLTSQAGCTYTTPPVNIVVWPLPTAELNVPATVLCSGQPLVLSGQTASDNQLFWYGPSGASPDTLLINPLEAGDWTYSCTVANANTFCEQNYTVNLHVLPTPEPPVVSIADTPTPSCLPYAFPLEANTNSGTVEWSDGQTGNAITAHYPGWYQATVNDHGCTNSSRIELPEPPDTYSWMIPYGCYQNCAKPDRRADITLLGPPSPISFAQWRWLYNGSSMLDSSEPSPVAPITVNQSGVYQLELNNGYCTYTNSGFNYNVEDCNECDLWVDVRVITHQDSPFESYQMLLQMKNTGNVERTYYLGSSDSQFMAIPSQVTLTPSIVYQVNVTLIPRPGFDINSHQTLSIMGLWPDVDYTDYCYTTINLGHFPAPTPPNARYRNLAEQARMAVYPNPGSEGFSIDYAQIPSGSQLQVYDLTGRNLGEVVLPQSQGQYSFDTIAWPSGTYVVVVRADHHIIYQQLWIKK